MLCFEKWRIHPAPVSGADSPPNFVRGSGSVRRVLRGGLLLRLLQSCDFLGSRDIGMMLPLRVLVFLVILLYMLVVLLLYELVLIFR